VAATPDTAGLRQTAYRIRIATSIEKLHNGGADLWDSEKIASDISQHISYAGRPLATRQQAFWTVQLWDQNARPTTPCAPANWSMGLLDSADWQADWIGLDTPAPPEMLDAEWFWSDEGRPLDQTPPGTRLFTRRFDLKKSAAAGDLIAFVSAGDYARLSVDGTRIGEAYGWADATTMPLPGLAAGEHVITAEARNLGSIAKPAGLAVRLEPLFSTAAGWQGSSEQNAAPRPVVTWGATGIAPWGPVTLHRPRAVPARWLRRVFFLAAPPRTASLSFCGLGWSEAYVNGAKAGDSMLSPPLTDYDRRVTYVTYDVASLLRPGANVVGVVLGPGRFVAPRPSARDFGWPKLLLRLDILLTDGRSIAVTSDDRWQITLDGPIRDANEYDGETVDGRMAMPGWSEAGFDSRTWRPAELVAAPAGRLTALRQPPTRITAARSPIRITGSTTTGWMFDFGQNLAGLCRLQTTGPPGRRITLQHAERLQPNGDLDTANLRSAQARDIFILAGNPSESHTPRFTSHGFRYVHASGLAAPPTQTTLTALVMSDDLRRTGHFDCSDPILTRIHDAALWSVRNNCRSIRTDCPQRDERQGWLGDPAEEARGEAYLFDNAAFYAKWLFDMLDTQHPDGALADIAPAYWPLYNNDIAWPAALAIIPGILHDQYGDLAIIAEVYPALRRWLDKVGDSAGDKFGDWGFLGMADAKPDPLIGAAYLQHVQTLAGDYAARLGHTDEAAALSARAADSRTRFRTRFLSPDSLLQQLDATSCILALAFDLVPPAQITALRARLVSLILAAGEPHPCFGLIGAQWVNRVLQQAGRGDLAHRMAVARTRPGLGYMIAQGATTLWEFWDADTADAAMASLDHNMLTGDLIGWLYHDLAGIRPDPARRGFASAIIAPQPIVTLDWVRATYDAITGTFKSAWRRQSNRITFDITVPPNVKATILLPDSDPIKVASGHHRFIRP
jgi:alpha-L-rhamnosidase